MKFRPFSQSSGETFMLTSRLEAHDRPSHRLPQRLVWMGAFLVAMSSSVVSSPAQQPAAQKKMGVVREVSLRAADGWRLAATYYESTEGREASVVILLHGEGGNRLVWTNNFAKRLQDEGYAVLAFDFRKHGQSVLPGIDALPPAARPRVAAQGLNNADYVAMAAIDLDAAKKFLMQEHQDQKLNIRKTAIVAADISVPIAATYAVADWQKAPYPDAPTLAARTPKGQDVRALVLISPADNLPGLRAGQAYNALRAPLWNVAVLVAVGDQDPQDRGTARKIHQQLAATAGNDRRMYLKNYKTKFRGTDLIGQRLGVEEHMLAFLEEHVKRLNSDNDAWRDRKSPLFANDQND